MRWIVGIAELQVSADPDDVIVTYALGSCLGIAVHDPVARVSGLVHVLLPSSELDRARAAAVPATFVDTGFVALLDACMRLGAHPARLAIVAAGGADRSGTGGDDQFPIGRRNFLALRQVLWKRGLMLRKHDIGGSHPRTMSLEVASGTVGVQTYGHTFHTSTL